MRHPDLVNRAWPVAAAVAAMSGEGIAIAASTPGSARWNEAAVGAVVAAYAAVGLLILWHRPGHPIGRIATVIAPVWGVGEDRARLLAGMRVSEARGAQAAIQ